MPASIALVANPGSGSGDAGRVEQLLRGGGATVRVFSLEEAGEAARSGAERLAIAGGDGSIAAAASAAGKAGIPVAVIPAGTANDFAAAAGLPEHLEEACRLAARGERRRPVDVAWLGERPFVNVASAGLPPQAARRAAGLKGSLGPLAYLLGALAAAARSRPVECALACDGQPLFAGSAWQATVGCSGAFGAGSSVGGSTEDGLLHAVAVPAGSRLALLRRAYGLRRGNIGEQRGVASAPGRAVELDLPPGTELNVDGELVESGPVSVRIEPGAFELVVG
jgi:diacylglycerol kinase (ATP)